MRRLRERRRQGVRFVANIPVTDTMIDALISRGMLKDDDAANRDMIAQVLAEAIAAWANA